MAVDYARQSLISNKWNVLYVHHLFLSPAVTYFLKHCIADVELSTTFDSIHRAIDLWSHHKFLNFPKFELVQLETLIFGKPPKPSLSVPSFQIDSHVQDTWRGKIIFFNGR